MSKICKGKLCILQDTQGVLKKLEDFSISKNRKDGRESVCRQCRSYVRSKEYKELRKKELEEEKKQKELNIGKKRCKKCNTFLNLEHFSKQNSMKDGLASICRKCKSGKTGTNLGKVAKAIHTVQNGKEGKTCSICKKWKCFEENNFKKKGKYKNGNICYVSECRTCFNKTEQERYHENKVLMTEEELQASKEKKSKEYRSKIKIINNEKYKFCIREQEWVLLSKFKTDGNKKYITGEPKYRGYCNDCRNEQRRIRHMIDEEFRLLHNCRNRVYKVLKQNTKSDNTMKLLGCSIKFLWNHLEKQFQPGMTRENYGPVWHVDHIRPCSIFDLSDPREQRRCFNWRNLQPMFEIENLQKSNSYKFDIVHEIKLHFIK